MLFHTILSLNRIPAHELPLRLSSFYADIQVAKPFYNVVSEEIFMEAAAYLMLLGIQNGSTPIPNLVLAKGENGNVGTFNDIPIRSDVFTPRELRNSENVPTNAIEYRAFGE